jgi:FO synthase
VTPEDATLDDATLARLRPRALHRAEEGRTLKADEAAALLTATDADLERLVAVAGAVRDAAPWYRDGAWGRVPEA